MAAYTEAAFEPLENRYGSQRELASPQMRGPGNIRVFGCSNGMLVRYDLAVKGQEGVWGTTLDVAHAEAAVQLSDNLIHLPQDPESYTPSAGGIERSVMVTDSKTGITAEHLKARP